MGNEFTKSLEGMGNDSNFVYMETIHTMLEYVTGGYKDSSKNITINRNRPNEIKLIFVKMLGKGTYGTVSSYTLNGKLVAVKEYFIDPKDDDDEITFKVDKITTELMALIEITKLNNLAVSLEYPDKSLIDTRNYKPLIRTSDSSFHIVMTYIQGNSISKYINGSGKIFTPKDIITYAKSITSELNILHSNNMVHRDLSPYNVIITKEAKGSIIDYGTLCNDNITNILKVNSQCYDKLVGTKIVNSPELTELFLSHPEGEEESNYDLAFYKKCDIWALGIHFLLMSSISTQGVGDIFETSTISDIPTTFKMDNIYPKEFEELVYKCLSVDPDLRPTSQELLDGLNDIETPNDVYDDPRLFVQLE